jgi:hypothetical protein
VYELDAAGADVAEAGHPVVYNQLVAGGAAHEKPRIYVTFPAMETSKAQNGYCWLSNINTEEALSIATGDSGFSLAKRTEVEVTGILGHIGPFFWIGQPAYRIPVGSRYAHPGPDVLSDLVFDYWSRFDAFREDLPAALNAQNGLLQYAHDYEAAEVAFAAGGTARARIGPAALPFSFSVRQVNANGRMFHTRANGILQDLTYGITEYDHTATIRPYNTAYGGDVPAGAINIAGPLLVLDVQLAANNPGIALPWADAYRAQGWTNHIQIRRNSAALARTFRGGALSIQQPKRICLDPDPSRVFLERPKYCAAHR